jgi:hypothetical protein
MQPVSVSVLDEKDKTNPSSFVVNLFQNPPSSSSSPRGLHLFFVVVLHLGVYLPPAFAVLVLFKSEFLTAGVLSSFDYAQFCSSDQCTLDQMGKGSFPSSSACLSFSSG